MHNDEMNGIETVWLCESQVGFIEWATASHLKHCRIYANCISSCTCIPKRILIKNDCNYYRQYKISRRKHQRRVEDRRGRG
jgi:hypothetical protein